MEPQRSAGRSRSTEPREKGFRGNSSPQSLFVTKGPTDLLRDSWRLVVFRVDYRSATAIADIMLKELPEKEIHRLLSAWNVARNEHIIGLDQRTNWSRDDEFIDMSPEFSLLWETVEKYRRVHADRLYRYSMIDVDVVYKECSLRTYREDAGKIRQNGGNVYRFWPERKDKDEVAWPQRLTISIIIKRESIKKIYPQSRDDVRFSTNTDPVKLEDNVPAEPALFLSRQPNPATSEQRMIIGMATIDPYLAPGSYAGTTAQSSPVMRRRSNFVEPLVDERSVTNPMDSAQWPNELMIFGPMEDEHLMFGPLWNRGMLIMGGSTEEPIMAGGLPDDDNMSNEDLLMSRALPDEVVVSDDLQDEESAVPRATADNEDDVRDELPPGELTIPEAQADETYAASSGLLHEGLVRPECLPADSSTEVESASIEGTSRPCASPSSLEQAELSQNHESQEAKDESPHPSVYGTIRTHQHSNPAHQTLDVYNTSPDPEIEDAMRDVDHKSEPDAASSPSKRPQILHHIACPKMFFSTLVTAAFAATAFASPISNKVVHEKRDALPQGWSKRSALDRRAILPMKIGLTQNNLHKGGDWLHEVSDPDSKKYGQHWSAKDIAEAFSPSEDTVNTVKAWLAAHGIGDDRVSHGQSMGFLHFDATVDEAENLLSTSYNVYEHDETNQPHVACEEYSLPHGMAEHVDFITPSIHFDAPMKHHAKRASLENREIIPEAAKSIGKPTSPSLPKKGATLAAEAVGTGLNNCSSEITPDCLRALYEFPVGSLNLNKYAYGIVEYTPEAYVPSDLDMFFRKFAPKAVGERPVFDSIDGGVNQQTNMSFDYNGESDLDLQYSMSLVYPQDVVLYQVGDLVEGASFNNFLDAIDKSYCTFEGGDNPNYDGTYPDPLPGGYKGPENCGGFAATRVISTSYGADEAALSPKYEERQCQEYLKLGLMGVSVLYSSGDSGVAGGGGACIGTNGSFNNGNSGRFNPSFPATCPWLTAVGATQVKPGVNVPQAIASGTEPEEACETVIYSGGGFSNVFAQPSYQAAAVAEYYKNYNPPYTAAQYNNSRHARGFPDVSANGANYIVAVDGDFTLVYGTSASSPTFGSILTLINEQRFAKGWSSVGFVNPVLYKNPDVLNDITVGDNPGCGTSGFSAVPGWDPVTGLGTPNYPKMLKLFMSLGNGWGSNNGNGWSSSK